ncbi:MAG: VWA domain-containing protein [Myxococcales bacterium]|nr:VWA domain-containing protein [Myxococcales bacterium]
MSPPVSQRVRASLPSRPRDDGPKKKRPWVGRFVFFLAVAVVAGGAGWAFYKYGIKSGAVLSYKRGDTTYELLSPKMLGLILLAPFFLYMTGKSLADLPWPQRLVSFLMRTAFVLLLAFGLGRVAKTAFSAKVCTVYVVDVSESIPDEAIADAQAVVDKAWKERGEGEVRVITFAVRPRLLGGTDPANPALTPPKLERHDPAGQRIQGAGTDIQAALQLAYGLYPSGYLKRVVLFSDGVQTAGDALAEAGRAREFGVKMFTIPYKRPVPAEVAVRELRVPPKIKVGEPFEIRAIIFSNRPAKVRARLYQGEALNGLDGIRDLDLKVGENDIPFKSVVRVPGAVTYAIDVEPIALLAANPTGPAPVAPAASASASAKPAASASGSVAAPPPPPPVAHKSKPGLDRFVENNKYAVTVAVPGRPSVLYIEGDTGHGSYLTNALVAQEFEVDLRGPDGIPTSLKEIERYDFVILSDTSADRVTYAQQDLLESYVKDLGGGFLMAGGQNSFGLGGWRHTKIEKILPVRMDAEKKKDQPSIALCLVIDRSGSMSGQKIEMAKEAAKATAETLSPDDYIEVIAFDSAPMRLVRMQSARNRMRILSDISRLQPNGGTDIFPAVQMANEDLALVPAKRKHMILLSDGEAPIGGIKELVQEMVSEGMTASAVALGEDADKNLMKMVAETGGGRFYFVKDPSTLPRIFTKETELVSKTSAIDEYFQPTVVSMADFIRGIDFDNSPYLHGFVATQLKPPPAQLVLVPGDHEEPLLARWRVGLGWTLAWTSDVKNLWAAEWLRWPQYPQFWGQLVREHMRQKKRQQLDMKVELVDGVVKASVDAIGGDDRFQNGNEGKITILGPAPKMDKVVVPLQQVAPGRYEARHTLDQFGSFVLTGELLSNGTPVAESFGHVSNPYPKEYAAFEPDLVLMNKLATSTGGAVDPAPPLVIDPAGEKVSYHEDLWMNFVKAAILVFVIDLALRRFRFFESKIKAAA